jgi:predicted nucleotidyltransferase
MNPKLRAAGVESVSLFGSVARGESRPQDVDIAVKLGSNFSTRGWDYFGRLDALQSRLSRILNCGVDVVEEPVRKARFQQAIDKDRASCLLANPPAVYAHRINMAEFESDDRPSAP